MSELKDYIEQLRNGSEEAFEQIYNLFEKPLYNHLYKMLGSEAKAQEVFQEVMITLIKKIEYYSDRSDLKNSFKAWLFRIATNLAIDEIRRNKKVSFIEEVPEIAVEEDAVEFQDMKGRVNTLIMKLPTIQRTFLNLKVNEDLSHMEIAAVCGCQVNAVKQGLFRARKTLKDMLIKEGFTL